MRLLAAAVLLGSVVGPRSAPVAPTAAPVVYVDPRAGFVAAALGSRPDLRPGARFEVFGADGAPRHVRVEFEKHLGNGRAISKLRLVDGDLTRVRLDDRAVLLPGRR